MVIAGFLRGTIRGRRSSTQVEHRVTTPSALRIALIVLAVAIPVCGALALRGVLDRRQTAAAVGDDLAPLLVDAQDLYLALADADAAASTIFLQAGLEPQELRDRYVDDLQRAGRQLTGITADRDLSATSQEAIDTISEVLPKYSSLVEAARTNNRLEHPVGAAYLRQASELMGSPILPAARTVFEDAGRRLEQGYDNGSSTWPVVAVVVAIAIIVVGLLVVQLFTAVRTRRMLNLGLAGATLALVLMAVIATALLETQRRTLATSQREGSDLLITLSVVRILALRSLNDENLYLIDREETFHLEDFDAVTASIADTDSGLLARASAAAPDAASQRRIDRIADTHGEYLDVHELVRELDAQQRYDDAEELAVGELAAAADTLDGALEAEIERATAALDDEAARAASAADWLPQLVVILTVLALAATVVGLELRLREYR